MRIGVWLFALALLTPSLSACELGGGERSMAPPDTSELVSTDDPRLPEGFSLATGSGGVRDLAVSGEPGGDQVISYATIAPPRFITQFYRQEATAARMTYAGQMDAGDMIATNFARTEGAPRRLSVSASKKGEFTNISLTFNAE
jgi:hypothetical protein